MAKTVKELMTEAKAGLKELTPAEARAAAEAGEAVLVDVRDGAELAANGRVPGAVHASRGLLEFRLDPASPMHDARLASGKPLIFFCASGGRSALAARTARDFGYDRVSHIAGGFGAWTEAGQPVER